MNCLLGLLLMNKGDLGAAEPLVRDALQVRRETVGDRHPDTLCAMSPLGMLLYAKDDLASAVSRCFAMRLTCRARPWAIGTHRHSHLHERPRQAVLRAKGDFAAAEPLLREALGVQRETLGDRHPHTLDLLNNLGRLLKEKGELAAAEPLSREALEGRREKLGARHPDTLSSISNLGLLLMAKGDLTAAEPLLRKALEGRREVLGARHKKTLAASKNLGALGGSGRPRRSSRRR